MMDKKNWIDAEFENQHAQFRINYEQYLILIGSIVAFLALWNIYYWFTFSIMFISSLRRLEGKVIFIPLIIL